MDFVVWALIAVLGFGFSSTLLIHYARKYDGRLTVAVRNISLIISGLPLLFFVQEVDVSLLVQNRYRIMIAAMTGVVQLFMLYEGYTYISVGTGGTIRKGVALIASLGVALIVLGEQLNLLEWSVLIVISAASLWLSSHKETHVHLDHKHKTKGVLMMCVAGVLYSLSIFAFTQYAKQIDTLLAAYVLESSLGILLVFWLVRECVRGTYDVRALVSLDTGKMIAISCLVWIGTIGMTMAYKTGGFGIVSGLLNLSIPVAIIIARIAFGEKLKKEQIISIAIVLLAMMALKIYG